MISPTNSYAAPAHRRHICLLEFAIVLKLKNNLENSRGKMHWLQMNPPWESGLINLINPNPNLSLRVSPSRPRFFLAAPISLTYKHLLHRLVKNLGPESILLPWCLSIMPLFYGFKWPPLEVSSIQYYVKIYLGLVRGMIPIWKRRGYWLSTPNTVDFSLLFKLDSAHEESWQPFLMAHGCDDSILTCATLLCNLEVRRDQLFLLTRFP